MPYISQLKREQLDGAIDKLHSALVDLELDDDHNNMEGNINYVVSRLMLMVYGDRDTTNYSQINDALGVLSAIKSEFYRKVAAPYEDQKSFENGEVVRFMHEPEIVGTVSLEVPAEVMDHLTND